MKVLIIIITLTASFLPAHAHPFRELAMKAWLDWEPTADTSVLYNLVEGDKEVHRKFLKGYSEKTIDLLAWAGILNYISGFKDGWESSNKIIDSINIKQDSMVFRYAYSFGWESGYNVGYKQGLNRTSIDYNLLLLKSLLDAMPRRYEIDIKLPKEYRIDFYYHPKTSYLYR